MPPLTPLLDKLTCHLRPCLPGDSWVSGESLDITVDRYVDAVLKLSLWIDLQMLTSVFQIVDWKMDVIQELPELVLII